MKLTTPQIQQIEKYLDAKNIYYIDVRFELLDHIITEIEEQLKITNQSFEAVFQQTCKKWSPHFKEKTSLFFGLGFSAPSIIINKAKKLYAKHYLLLLGAYFIPFLVLTHYNFIIQNTEDNLLFDVLKTIAVLSLLAFIGMIIFKKNKHKTTYGFILKSQSLGVFTGLIVTLILFYSPRHLDGIVLGMCSSYFCMTYSYALFFKKHQQTVTKFKML